MWKLKTCKTCGAQIAKNAKRCPQCGAKNVTAASIAGSVIGGFILFVVIIAVFVSITDDGTVDVETTTNPDTGETEAIVIEVTAADLYAAYVENAVAADAIYKDKVVQVTGTVSNIGQDLLTDDPCVSLDSGSAYGIAPIQCFFSSATSEIAELRDGDTITIRGKCTGAFVSTVQLTRCEIIQKENS